jgi:DnaJ family protein C protein 25
LRIGIYVTGIFVLQAEDKQDAEVRFRAIATAYEVLKDDETHRDYDYYLDHPDEFYYNTYAYYRRRVAPKVDVRYVIAGTILVISIVQVGGEVIHGSMVPI